MVQDRRVTSASEKSLATEGGQSKAAYSDDLIQTINEVVAILRLNYHNQFSAAFKTEDALVVFKRLLAENLASYDSYVPRSAIKKLIRESEYLPTLSKIIDYCNAEVLQANGLPNAYRAYEEACNAPSPKAAFKWSHAAVYQAGKDVGWQFLASEVEKTALPKFQRIYKHWCERVIAGETIPSPDVPELPEKIQTKMTKEERIQAAQKLKALLNESTS
jgi:hypothetical protein